MLKIKRTGENCYYKITRELGIKINAKMKILQLTYNPICYRFSNSTAGDFLLEVITN
jgi:hypothetical protein